MLLNVYISKFENFPILIYDMPGFVGMKYNMIFILFIQKCKKAKFLTQFQLE